MKRIIHIFGDNKKKFYATRYLPLSDILLNKLASSAVIQATGILVTFSSYLCIPVCGVYKEYGVTDLIKAATAPYFDASVAPLLLYFTVSPYEIYFSLNTTIFPGT